MPTRVLIARRLPLSPGQQLIPTLLLGIALLPALASAQTPTAAQVEATIPVLQSGDFGPATPDQIEQARTGQLLPVLRDLFARNPPPARKAAIASTLIRLGDKDVAYWNFLVDYARPALESDAPSSRPNGPPERLVNGHTPEYNQWASAHPAAYQLSEQTALLTLWQLLYPLATVGDPRSIPLLQKVLHSPNFELVAVAAQGLAAMHDKASIPLIIEACRRAPPQEVRGLAVSLRYFEDDPQAKAVADTYDPPPNPLQALAKNDEVSPFFLEQIAKAHTVKAIPILKRNFEQMANLHDKAHTASVLIRLGDEDPTYWNFLVQQATAAVESDAPNATAYDAQGKPLPDPSPAFVAWAKAHNLLLQGAAEELLFGSADVAFLGMTGDPRAIPTLRRGLSATNAFTVNAAAEGLAKLQDLDSVPLIIETCRRAPPEVASLIASSALIRFKDSRAQQAVDSFLPPDQLTIYRADKHHAPGSDPFAP